MKKLYVKLIKVDVKLDGFRNELENIKKLPYYKIFGTESERQRDLDFVAYKIKKFLNIKFRILENLQLAIEKEKFLVSTKSKELNLKKAS